MRSMDSLCVAPILDQVPSGPRCFMSQFCVRVMTALSMG